MKNKDEKSLEKRKEIRSIIELDLELNEMVFRSLFTICLGLRIVFRGGRNYREPRKTLWQEGEKKIQLDPPLLLG